MELKESPACSSIGLVGQYHARGWPMLGHDVTAVDIEAALCECVDGELRCTR